MELNGKKVIDYRVDGVHKWDTPDFADAYFSEAFYEDGTALTDDELDALANAYPDVIYDNAIEQMYL